MVPFLPLLGNLPPSFPHTSGFSQIRQAWRRPLYSHYEIGSSNMCSSGCVRFLPCSGWLLRSKGTIVPSRCFGLLVDYVQLSENQLMGIPAAAQSIALACSAGEFGRDEDGGGGRGRVTCPIRRGLHATYCRYAQ